ncbi:MAG: SH3 domain-containing protein [Pirellulales bacterium]
MSRRHAWLLLLTISGGWPFAGPPAEAAEKTPYVGYITADNVDVRSGPGEEYYPAMRLGRRDRVEVYRHDPGGWFAVRPPQHSFSWVSGDFIRRGAGDVGEVIGDRVVVRVGSIFDNARDVIQVRLNRGEEVQILGSHEFDDGAGPRVWYQIAPPAGEFRWIHGRFISSQPLDVGPSAAEPRDEAAASRDRDEDAPPRDRDEQDPPRDRDEPRYDDDTIDRQRDADRDRDDYDRREDLDREAAPHVPTVRVSRRDALDEDRDRERYGDERYDDRDHDRHADDDDAAYDRAPDRYADDDSRYDDEPDSPASRRDRARRQRLREAADAEEAAEAAALDRERAELRARRRTAEAGPVDHERDEPAPSGDDADLEARWHNRHGGRESRGGREQSAEPHPSLTTDERYQAEIDELDLELSAMVAQEAREWNFTNLRARGEAMLGRGQTALERGRVRRVLTKLEKFADIKQRLDAAANIAADTNRRNSLVSSAPSQSRGPHMRPEFDGIGRLARVQSDRAGVPAFALTDSSGAVRYYVTPSPGTNLQHYVGQEVGINGTLGFLPELNTQHVTARRVESINAGGTLVR